MEQDKIEYTQPNLERNPFIIKVKNNFIEIEVSGENSKQLLNNFNHILNNEMLRVTTDKSISISEQEHNFADKNPDSFAGMKQNEAKQVGYTG